MHWSFWPASKAYKLETFRVERRSCRWDSIPLIPLIKCFKRVIKPSTICQNRLRLSANTWKQSIWCPFCLRQIKQFYLELVQENGEKTKATRPGSISICFSCMSGESLTAFCTRAFLLRHAHFFFCLYGIGYELLYEEAFTVGVTGQINYYSHFKLSTLAPCDAISKKTIQK